MKKKIPLDYNYSVDPQGRIYGPSGKELSLTVNRDGYYIVKLWKNNKAVTKAVHRLVALTWIPNPEGKRCVNHIDGNKLNNDISNLEWVTHSENSEHSHELGLQVPKEGEDNPGSKYTNEIIHEVCRLMEEGFRNVDIHKRLGVPVHLIKNIRYHNAWFHISSQYKIPNRRYTVGEKTVHWVCRMIEAGKSNKEILEESTSSVTKRLISNIRRKTVFLDIVSQYSF